MIPTTKRSPIFKFAGYALAGFFIFLLAFFIQYGKEARASRSWHYVMSTDDDMCYWSVAKGRMMTPRCDGNPFYSEHQGTRRSLPYTTAETIGLISQYTRIPLSWFFPAWHILMPFLTWLVIVLCCWKLWGYPLGVSTGASMLLLLSLLFFPWPVWPILIRFPRPLEGIALLFVWISLLFRGDPCNRKHRAAIILAPAVAFWLQPYYAVFGLWITGLEAVRFSIPKVNLPKIRLHLDAFGSALVAGLLFGAYVLYGKNKNPEVAKLEIIFDGSPLFSFFMSLLFLIFLGAAVLFFAKNLKRKITSLDRLILEWAAFGVLIYGVVGAKMQMAMHLFYFVPIMIFSFTAWVYEKLNPLKGTRSFRWLGFSLAGAAGVLAVFSIVSKQNLFLLGSTWGSMHFCGYISRYLLILAAVIWLLLRLDSLRRMVMRKEVVCGLVLLLTVAGFWRIPLNPANRHFPFGNAYRWMNENAKENEVVLVASYKYWNSDYLFLKTGLKPYLNGFGQYFSGNHEENNFREYFVQGLLLGALERMPFYGGWTVGQKLRYLRLNYILMPMPSPFFEAVTGQLRGHLQQVYQDAKCVLWKVI